MPATTGHHPPLYKKIPKSLEVSETYCIFAAMNRKKRRKDNNMNVAIGMMLFIFIVANVGGLYFYLQGQN